MGRAAVRVICRTRPTDSLAKEKIQFLEDGRSVLIRTVRQQSELVNNTVGDHIHKLDLVLKDASQEHTFDMAAGDMIRSLMAGYNGTVLCYGQTGSGKTYTMFGGGDYTTRGMCPRAVKAVFEETINQPDRIFQISVSFLEVYNERIKDLLDPASKEDFAVQEDAKGNITVRGIQQRVCSREEEALALLFEGNMNRTVADHTLNANSSRSHCIFTIHVTSRSRVESDSVSITSKIHFADLAGSERLSKTGSDGATAKEAQFINKSLTFLEQVVMALGSTSRSHVPFRQSKLTSLLKDSLGGNCKTTMIANIWPEDRNIEESLGTLRFASRMMKVQTEATVNVVLDPATQIKQLQRTIGELKSELQMQNQLMGKSHISYDGDVADDERYDMEKTVKAYLSGQSPEIPVRSLREVREYFRIFKAFSDQRDAEAVAAAAAYAHHAPTAPTAQATSGAPHSSRGISSAAQEKAGAAAAAAGGAPRPAGIIDKASGISVGVAAPCKSLKDVTRSPTRGQRPLDASPVPGGAARSGSPDGGDTFNDTVGSMSPTRANTAGGDGVPPLGYDGGVPPMVGPNGAPLVDQRTAFEDYKRSVGAKLVGTIKAQQAQLAAHKKRINDLVAAVNDAKAVIDGFSQKLEQRRQERVLRGEAETVDNEEFAIVKHVKDAKSVYSRNYEELTSAKSERDHVTKTVTLARQQLLGDFERWYQMVYEAPSSLGLGLGGSAANSPAKSFSAGARGGSMQQQGMLPVIGGGPRPPATGRPYPAAMGGAEEENLDEGEWFDLLQMNRVRERDPEAVAYYSAKKVVRSKLSKNGVSAGAGNRTVSGTRRV